MNEELHANRKHKDTVFRMLYSDKRAILELYNALNGTDYQNPDDLTITTLENAVYMAMKNDVSFLLDARMTLYEVHVESEHALARSALYCTAYGKECG